jgi:hypothetical protein
MATNRVKDKKMTKEIYEYFHQQYKEAEFRVVPGHWPEFQSKKEVDQWIKLGNGMKTLVNLKGKDRLPDDDDF